MIRGTSRVESNGYAQRSGPLAGKSGGAPAVLLQITDTHLCARTDSVLRGRVTETSFAAVLEHARNDPRWPPDAMVVTGDIVHDESRAGYRRFGRTLEALGLPVYCVPGNHDDPSLMAECLTAPRFQICGDTRLGAWRAILLSTFLEGEVGGALGAPGLARLEETLERHSREHTLICLHHQPLPIGSAWLDAIGLRDAAQFLETVWRHDQVRAVLWGHVHQASDRRLNGVRFLSCPSTCAQFRPHSREFAVDNRPPGLRWLELWPDGGLTTEVGWVEEAAQP